MPKVSIREIDNTGGENLQYLDYTVLIPGPELKFKFDSKDTTDTILDSRNPKIGVLTKTTFLNKTFTNVNNINYKADLGYLMAKELVNQGLSVLFVPAYTIRAEGASKPNPVIDHLLDDVILDPENDENFFKDFADRGKYDLRFISIGGLYQLNDNEDVEKALKSVLLCAGNRGDAVATLSVPEEGSDTDMAPLMYSVYKKDSSYSKDPTTGYKLTYLKPEEFYALSEANQAKCTKLYVEHFIVYTKETEQGTDYSKTAQQGYTKTELDLDGYRDLSEDAQSKCTLEEAEQINLDNTDKINNWVNNVFKVIANRRIERSGISWTTDENRTESYGRYGAVFAPLATTQFEIENKKTDVNMPAEFHYLACFAKHIRRFKPWWAMSGSVRGVSPYLGIQPTIAFGDADINNVFQIRTAEAGSADEGHIATNVICEIRPYGNIIWGNRTMNPLGRPENADADSAIQLVASDFLNIRQLCCSLKKTLYRAARKFTFEPNSDALWYNFKGAITPLLDEMKANQGIKGYQIIKVRTNKKALLVARIKIVPIEAVEDFDLTVELTDSIEVTE